MNLILNGSFETGDFTNWSGTGTEGMPFNAIIPSPFGMDGNAFQIGYWLPTYISQFVFGLDFNVEYELSYQLLSTVGGDGVSFTVGINGENDIPALTIDNTFPEFPWTRVSYRFTNRVWIYLFINAQQSQDYFYLTDISLVEVAVPVIPIDVEATVVLSDVITGKTIHSEVITTDGSLSICPYQDVENLDIGGSVSRGTSGSTTAAINIGNGTINNFPINIGNCPGTTSQTNIGNLNVTNITSTTGLITALINTPPGVNTLTIGGNCSDVNISGSLTTTGHSLTQSAGSGSASHNFASCNTQYNGYDAQIITTGGTSALTNSGTLEIKAATINLTATNNLTMGSATSANTFIKNSISTIVGTNPTSYNNTAKTISGTAISLRNKMLSGLGESELEMYSSGLTNASHSSSIKSFGGTSAINTGTLNIESGSINIQTTNGNVNITPSTDNNTIFLGANTCSLEIGNVDTFLLLKFHSCTTAYNARDGGINCSGGVNATSDGGVMSYNAAMHDFGSDQSTGGVVIMSGGYSFNNSNPFYQQHGVYVKTGFSLAAGASWTSPTQTFTTAFGGIPTIIQTLSTTGSVAGNVQKMIVSVSTLIATGFTLTFYNASTTAVSGNCGVNWFANGYV